VLAEGALHRDVIPTGTVSEVDLIRVRLTAITRARKLTITLALTGTAYRNSYDLWVYPAEIDTKPPAGVVMAAGLTAEVRRALAGGARVLLLPDPGSLRRTVAMAFTTGFWSCMFRMGDRIGPLGETPGTQGILCDPTHPLFRDFPTEYHSNWQWWQLVKHCNPMILDGTPHDYRPTLQVIDGIDRNYKLGLTCEANVGKGRLLICTIHLKDLQQHPEARQLLANLYRYAGSDDFNPRHDLEMSTLETIL
jgi:hypothetical protein